MNWNVSTIWDVRDKLVTARDGKDHLVKLYVEGWQVGDRGSLDIWAACQILNNMEAQPSISGKSKVGTLKYGYEEWSRGLPPMPAPAKDEE